MPANRVRAETQVFVPLFLQATTSATPTQAGLLLVPMMLGITLSTNVAGRLIARTGRYKAFPVGGLALMSTGLIGLAVTATQASRTLTVICRDHPASSAAESTPA